MHSRMPYLLGLLGLIIVGALFRIGPAMSLPMWFDEADTWRSGIIDPTTSGWDAESGLYEPQPMEYGKFFRWQNHFETAPLAFLVSRISTDLLGSTEPWAMRIPALIAGLLCIPAAFWLGKVVRDDALGLLTAALVTFDPSQVDQSHQCRMYAIMMLLMLLAIALTIKLVREPEPGVSLENPAKNSPWLHPVWQWVALGALYGLLLCVTQFSLAVWVGITLGGFGLLALGLITKQPHAKTKQVIVGLTSAFLVGIMLANVGIHSIIQRVFHGGEGDRPNLTHAEMIREIIVAMKDLIDLTSAGLAIYILVAIGLVLLFKKCKTSTAILLGVVVANVLMLFSFLRIHHFMDIRYISPMQPAIYIGLAMFALGFAKLALRRGALALVILFIAVQAWQSTRLTSYYMQADRYVFTQSILQAKAALKPGETMSIYPGVGCILGKYYECPMDPKLFTSLYDLHSHLPLETQKIPADLKASGVQLVLGMYNYETAKGDQKRKRSDMIRMLAAHYGVTVDDAELDKHLKQHHVTTAHISGQGVKLSTAGVE